MKHKKSFSLSTFIVGILILVPIYLFVGCGNKETSIQTANTKNVTTETQDNSKSQDVNKDQKADEDKETNKNQDVNKDKQTNKTEEINKTQNVSKNENDKEVITAKEKNKNVKSESQVSNKKEETRSSTNKFTSKDAINICEKKYGKDSDTIYACSEEMKNVNGEKGYLVQVKSKELMKQGGNGVAFTVLVTTEGQIIEL